MEHTNQASMIVITRAKAVPILSYNISSSQLYWYQHNICHLISIEVAGQKCKRYVCDHLETLSPSYSLSKRGIASYL